MVQTSDYQAAHNVAAGIAQASFWHRVFTPYWGYYEEVLGAVYKVFGATQLVGTVFNACISAASAVLFYFIGVELFYRARVGIVLSLLYTFLPSDIIYVNCLSGEFLARFGLLAGLLAHLVACRLRMKASEENRKAVWVRFFVLCATSGVLLALSDVFKPLAIVFVVSVICTSTWAFAKSWACGQTSYAEAWRIAGPLLMTLCFFGSKSLIVGSYEAKYGVHVRNNKVGWYDLYVGTNLKSGGMLTAELAENLNRIVPQHAENFSALDAECKALVIAQFKSDIRLLPLAVRTKFQAAFGEDQWGADWVCAGIRGSMPDESLERIAVALGIVSNVYYLFILLFAVFACITMSREGGSSSAQLSIALAVFGSALAFMFLAAQGRYKSTLITPFVVILAANGLRQSGFFTRGKSGSTDMAGEF